MFSDQTPSSGAALTFEAFIIISRALKSLSNKAYDPDVLIGYIRSNRFESTTGSLFFGRTSGTPDRQIVMLKLDADGEYRPVKIKEK